MPKPIEVKEQICKRISETLTAIVKEGKLAMRIYNGFFVPDDKRSQFIKVHAEELVAEKEILDAISASDLERIIFDALVMTRNKLSIQDQASAAAKLMLAQRQTKKP